DVCGHELGCREERSHVAVHVRGPDPKRECAVNLRAQLAFDHGGLRPCRHWRRLARKGAGGIEQTLDSIARLYASPSIGLPLAVEREVQPEVRVRMGSRIGG